MAVADDIALTREQLHQYAVKLDLGRYAICCLKCGEFKPLPDAGSITKVSLAVLTEPIFDHECDLAKTSTQANFP